MHFGVHFLDFLSSISASSSLFLLFSSFFRSSCFLSAVNFPVSFGLGLELGWFGGGRWVWWGGCCSFLRGLFLNFLAEVVLSWGQNFKISINFCNSSVLPQSWLGGKILGNFSRRFS